MHLAQLRSTKALIKCDIENIDSDDAAGQY